MMNILLMCNDSASLKQLEQGLTQRSDCQVTRAVSGNDALDKIGDKAHAVDLVIIDQVVEGSLGKAWVEKIISVNPMINTVLVSGLSEKDFHEDTEGLGVLLCIPPNPDESVAELVVERLSKVLSLFQNLGS